MAALLAAWVFSADSKNVHSPIKADMQTEAANRLFVNLSLVLNSSLQFVFIVLPLRFDACFRVSHTSAFPRSAPAPAHFFG
jgi:hypothetical protein